MNIVEFPIFKSILTPPLLFGMPEKFFTLYLVFVMTFVISIPAIPLKITSFVISLLFSVVIGAATKIDPYFFDIYMQLLKLPEVCD